MNPTVFEKLLAFNHWANEQYIATFSSQASILPERCIQLMSHIIGAEIIWLQRINNEPITPSAFSPKKIEELKDLNKEFSEKWLQKLLALTDAKDALKIDYKSLDGTQHTSSFNDILIHICNHATYHRAQIADELRNVGIKPPSTDYIVFSRG